MIEIDQKLEECGLRIAVEAIVARWPYLRRLAKSSAHRFAKDACFLPITEVCKLRDAAKIAKIANETV